MSIIHTSICVLQQSVEKLIFTGLSQNVVGSNWRSENVACQMVAYNNNFFAFSNVFYFSDTSLSFLPQRDTKKTTWKTKTYFPIECAANLPIPTSAKSTNEDIFCRWAAMRIEVESQLLFL